MVEDNFVNRYKIGAFFNSQTEELEFGIGYGLEKGKVKQDYKVFTDMKVLLE